MAFLFTVKDKPFLFVHIYKTGGNSIRSALKEASIEGTELHGGHCAFSDIQDLLPEGTTSFSVVRHPYEWTYSHFQHVKDMPHEHRDTLLEKPKFSNFLRMLRDLKEVPWKYRNNNYCSQFRMCNGVDHIFKLENLRKSKFKEISNLLGITLDIPHLNKARSGKLPISEAEKNEIQNLYPEDFDKLGYPL